MEQTGSKGVTAVREVEFLPQRHLFQGYLLLIFEPVAIEFRLLLPALRGGIRGQGQELGQEGYGERVAPELSIVFSDVLLKIWRIWQAVTMSRMVLALARATACSMVSTRERKP